MYKKIIAQNTFILGTGSMYERLKRGGAVEFDPHIAYASLIYHDKSRAVFESVYREYLDIGQKFQVPMIACTPTWRANRDRLAKSEYRGHPVNSDCVEFIQDLRRSYGPDASPIVIGGTIGPKGDGYIAEEAPSADDAEEFHDGQIKQLAEAGADFLIAKTLTAVREALGIARAMAGTQLPYVLSFVVRKDGTILDGTMLDDVIRQIDAGTTRPPTNYHVNCSHALVFDAALQNNPIAARRVTGLDANTSAKTPEELEWLAYLDTEPPEKFGKNLWSLHQTRGTQYLGGCCGSSTSHILALAEQYSQSKHD